MLEKTDRYVLMAEPSTEERLHHNQLHFDFSDASRKFRLNLWPVQDTLYASVEGKGPFHFEWNTGSTERFIVPEGKTKTVYSVSVTDGYGQQSTATAIYFFGSEEADVTPVFAGLGVYDVDWKIVSEELSKGDVEIIYTDKNGTIYYSQLADPDKDSYFDVLEIIPIRYQGTCIDLPCPEYFLGGIALNFRFSATLVSPDGKKVKMEEGTGLMPVRLDRELQ